MKIKNGTETVFHGKTIDINLSNLELNIGSMAFELTPIYNSKIIKAAKEGKVFLGCSNSRMDQVGNKPIYYSARSIMERKLRNEILYMDFLVYNNERDIFPNGIVNRSLGHRNDENEFEVHQVIQGTVLSLIKLDEDTTYVGVFKRGDYFEIPPGAFHCSYILEGPAIVANFYCNTFWGSDITKKPYFTSHNDISVKQNGNEYSLVSPNNLIEKRFTVESFTNLYSDSNFRNYEDLYKDKFLLNKHFEQKSIFDLFYSDSLNNVPV